MTLCLRDIPTTMNEKELRENFSPLGTILSIQMKVKHYRNGTDRIDAVMKFMEAKSAIQAYTTNCSSPQRIGTSMKLTIK